MNMFNAKPTNEPEDLKHFKYDPLDEFGNDLSEMEKRIELTKYSD